MKVMDRHNRAGRKNTFDVDAIEKIMAEKSIPIEQAYDEWDKPEREKQDADALEKKVQARVTEELQKRGTNSNFPLADAGAPSPLTTSASAKGFDRDKFRESLAQTFVTGEAPKVN